MAVKPRYVFGEAWSVARSGPRQTAMAVLLVALALYVPGLLALLSRNLGRLAVVEGEPVGVVVTLDPSADARALANRLAGEPHITRIRIVGSAAALERFRAAYPDLGQALTGPRRGAVPPFPRRSSCRGRLRRTQGVGSPPPSAAGRVSTPRNPRKSRDGAFATRSDSFGARASFWARFSRPPRSCRSLRRSASRSTSIARRSRSCGSWARRRRRSARPSGSTRRRRGSRAGLSRSPFSSRPTAWRPAGSRASRTRCSRRSGRASSTLPSPWPCRSSASRRDSWGVCCLWAP
jgi:hypothetical protein